MRLIPLLLLTLPGCVTTQASTTPFAGDETRLVILSEASPLAAEAPRPLLTPPRTFAVWVPSHVDRGRDLLIGEHWLVFKLTESEWFTDRRLEEAVPRAQGDATPADINPLRALRGFADAVTPYRESPR
jgi:hypothetical protein